MMKITTRAVLYIGYKCNLNCKFCYYHDVDKGEWKRLSSAKFEALKFRKLFGNDRVDLTGGEPTIYPYILELVRYCKKIGLRPSIITNGIALSDEKKVVNLKQAGVFDYLVSVHGLDEVYDRIVGVNGMSKIQKAGIRNIINNNIPLRINVTMNKFNSVQLPEIANYAVSINARVVNFINFNALNHWDHVEKIDFQEKYSIIVPYLRDAIKILDQKGIESNIRFFPLCLIKGLENHQYNLRQLPYDSHEWDYMSWHKNFEIIFPYLFKKFLFGKSKEKLSDYYMKDVDFFSPIFNCYKTSKCKNCSFTNICDGINKQYHSRFGDEELEPYMGEIINDPTIFIKDQYKITD